jgi:hypothetical protein
MTTTRRAVKGLRKPSRLALVVCLSFALVGAVSGVTFSAFTSQADNTGNVVTAAPDWAGPTVTGGGGRLNGPLGYIKQGDTVYLYLNVNDTGNPASGVATVNASVTVPGFGTATLPMTAGSYTVRGQTYNYRSAAQATPPTLPEQTLNVDVTATDNAGNTSNTTIPVVVDNSAPSATDIQTTNKAGGTPSLAEAGDTIVYTFSEPIDPETILAGWNGSSQAMRVRLIAGGAGNDTVQLWNSGNTAQLPLGTINLNRTDYINTGTATFGSSTMVLSGNTLTVTLGGAPTGGTPTTAGGTQNMVWTPAATATDLSGNAMSITARTEVAPTDRDF